MTESSENDRPKKGNDNRKRLVRRTLITGVAFIVGFIIFGVIAIQVWEYSNSVSFCANACHDVHPEEIPAYQDSFHANVKCTECHMGRVGTIRNIILKASHFRHLPEVIFDQYERPLESVTMRPANESCELCHWPPAFHGDTVREIVSFLPDEENTEKRTYLILKTGAGTREKGLGYGIHWHVTA
ncbi:MAG: NapC/NirT family cytochrome c, partial [Anaerolineae bacterium]